jgi:cytochrome oxidase assembly protein ShyY1
MLRQPRWAGFALLVILLCVLFAFLGRWQWHRHEDRRDRRVQYESVASAPVVPIGQVMTAPARLVDKDQYRLVTLTGTYDAGHQLLQRNPNGRSGFAVITPLVASDGEALLVNRGFVGPSTTDTNTPASDVTPPSGQVGVIVRLRESAAPDERSAPPGQVYSIDAAQIAEQLPYPVYEAYGELVEQDPPPPAALELPQSQSPGLGPHLFYAIQWWLFIGVAIAGFVLLLRRESTVNVPEPVSTVTSTPSGSDS